MGYLSAPEPSAREFREIFDRYYRLGRFVWAKKLKKGFANSLYHIRTTRGEFVFKISVRHNSPILNYEIKLLTTLKGLPIPRPIKTTSGKYLFDFKGHRSFVYPYLPGRQERKFTPAMLRAVGRFQGKLHLQTLGFRSPHVHKRVEYYALSLNRVRRMFKATAFCRNASLRAAREYLKTNALKYPLPKNLPRGAMHIDIKPENTLFQNGRLTGVVDFDNAYNGPLIFDLADTLMWYCSDRGKFRMERAKSIYQGYVGVRTLSALERDLILTALHQVFMGIGVCGMELLAKKTLPEDFIIWVIENLVWAERTLPRTPQELLKALK